MICLTVELGPWVGLSISVPKMSNGDPFSILNSGTSISDGHGIPFLYTVRNPVKLSTDFSKVIYYTWLACWICKKKLKVFLKRLESSICLKV